MGFLSDLIEGLVPDEIENLYKTPLQQATAPDITFQPFTVTGSAGRTSTDAFGSTTYSLTPQQEAMRQQLFGGAGQFYQNAMQDTAGRESDIYNRIRATQLPEQQRQRLALEERMFSQGRSGITTNQYGGAPEQLAFEKAIAEQQNSAMLTAMQQALAEQAQQATLGGQFLQQSYAPQAALLSSLAPALDVASMADVARRQQGEFGLEAQLANIQGELGQQTGLAQLYGGVYGGLLSGIGGLLGTSSQNAPWWTSLLSGGSDVRLKENIVSAGVTQDGIKLYTWDWKEEHKPVFGHQPTFGVLAQELLEVMPEAVHNGSDGYYRVDYSRVFKGEQ